MISLEGDRTTYKSTQMITLQKISYHDRRNRSLLKVQLNRELVEAFKSGATIVATGIVRYGRQINARTSTRKGDAAVLLTYLKSLAVQQVGQLELSKTLPATSERKDLIQFMRDTTSAFRLLVHSLCPAISGRKEIKAGLMLGLLSGSELTSNRSDNRSESHILLIG